MRYLTLTIFLAMILGFGGCGDTGNTGGDSEAGDGAMEEMTMEEGTMEEAPAEEMTMEEAPAEEMAMEESGAPQWTVLEQNVVHSE